MSSNNEDIGLFDLEFNGEYLFVFSDRFNIFLFFFDHEENKLYKITTDKFFIVESVDEVWVPSDFEDFTGISFFKPFSDNVGGYIFLGIVQINGKTYKFKISSRDRLEYTEEIEYKEPNGKISSLECLKSIKIFSCTRKDNHLWLVGYDNEYKSYIFAVADIKDDSMKKIYHLYSDYGDIIPFSVNLDMYEKKVYVVGKLVYRDSKNKVTQIKPFFESFSVS